MLERKFLTKILFEIFKNGLTITHKWEPSSCRAMDEADEFRSFVARPSLHQARLLEWEDNPERKHQPEPHDRLLAKHDTRDRNHPSWHKLPSKSHIWVRASDDKCAPLRLRNEPSRNEAPSPTSIRYRNKQCRKEAAIKNFFVPTPQSHQGVLSSQTSVTDPLQQPFRSPIFSTMISAYSVTCFINCFSICRRDSAPSKY